MGLFYGHNTPIVAPQRAINGYLYNWYAASDVNFAPTDWKVPSTTEYATLQSEVTFNGGGHLKEIGYIHWNSPNTGADNSTLFTGLGSGYRVAAGTFSSIKIGLFLYCSNLLRVYLLAYNNNSFNTANPSSQKDGASIRLLYTGAEAPTTVTDYDGNVYDTVTIGGQIWTKQNWRCTRLSNGDSIPNVTSNTAWAALTTLGRCAYDNNESYV